VVSEFRSIIRIEISSNFLRVTNFAKVLGKTRVTYLLLPRECVPSSKFGAKVVARGLS